MGYALFTARKLALNSRVNSMNAQLMLNSNQQYKLTQQISARQKAQSMRTAQASLNAYEAYAAELQEAGSDTGAQSVATAHLNAALQQSNVFSAQEDAELWKLEQQQDLLDIERETLETQLNAAQNELQAVEKAEESAIKNSTAKYCG